MRKILNLFLMVVLSLLLIFLSWNVEASPTYTMVDVSYGTTQGDTHVIIDGGKVILIDAGIEERPRQGKFPNKIVQYLRSIGVNKIDEFWVSHPHCDHYCGVRDIIADGIQIVDMIYSEPPSDLSDCCFLRQDWERTKSLVAATGTNLIDVSKGFKRRYKHGTMEVVFVQKMNFLNGNRVDLNDMSLVMIYKYGKSKIIFTGDLNKRVGEFLSTDKRMKADLLKIPHHGATGIAPDSFFDNVDPSLAFFPAPFWIESSDRGKQAFDWVKNNNIPFCVSSTTTRSKVTIEKDRMHLTVNNPDRSCRNRSFDAKHTIDLSWLPSVLSIILDD